MTDELAGHGHKLDLRPPKGDKLGIQEISPDQKLRKGFANAVLGFIGIFILFSGAGLYWATDVGVERVEVARAIFQFSKDLLPLGTLILGYFFGSNQPGSSNDG